MTQIRREITVREPIQVYRLDKERRPVAMCTLPPGREGAYSALAIENPAPIAERPYKWWVVELEDGTSAGMGVPGWEDLAKRVNPPVVIGGLQAQS
ncbi:MAG: hypothetical protein ABH833_03265 [Parcubacteria group bacterium]